MHTALHCRETLKFNKETLKQGRMLFGTDLVEEQDEIESKGNEQGQETQVVEVTRQVVLGENKKEEGKISIIATKLYCPIPVY